MVDLNVELPEGFLDEEIRCGHLVTHEMKKAWAVMLDLLSEFDRVCRKNGLRYYANGGTLLGAVRHKGFIPWDDDIDVMMFRKDYERLMRIGPEEFTHPYFLQNKYTDPEANDFVAKLRNSDTQALFDVEKNTFLEYNKGIFIDIFPLDNVPDDIDEKTSFYAELEKQRHRVFIYGRSIGIYTDSKRFFEHSLKKFFHRVLKRRRNNRIKTYLKAIRDYESLCSKYNNEDTEYVTTFVYGPIDRFLKYHSDLNDCVEMDFEFLKIPVCSGYDHYLKNEFGDYMKFVKGASLHGEISFDTEKHTWSI